MQSPSKEVKFFRKAGQITSEFVELNIAFESNLHIWQADYDHSRHQLLRTFYKTASRDPDISRIVSDIAKTERLLGAFCLARLVELQKENIHASKALLLIAKEVGVVEGWDDTNLEESSLAFEETEMQGRESAPFRQRLMAILTLINRLVADIALAARELLVSFTGQTPSFLQIWIWPFLRYPFFILLSLGILALVLLACELVIIVTQKLVAILPLGTRPLKLFRLATSTVTIPSMSQLIPKTEWFEMCAETLQEAARLLRKASIPWSIISPPREWLETTAIPEPPTSPAINTRPLVEVLLRAANTTMDLSRNAVDLVFMPQLFTHSRSLMCGRSGMVRSSDHPEREELAQKYRDVVALLDVAVERIIEYNAAAPFLADDFAYMLSAAVKNMQQVSDAQAKAADIQGPGFWRALRSALFRNPKVDDNGFIPAFQKALAPNRNVAEVLRPRLVAVKKLERLIELVESKVKSLMALASEGHAACSTIGKLFYQIQDHLMHYNVERTLELKQQDMDWKDRTEKYKRQPDRWLAWVWEEGSKPVPMKERIHRSAAEQSLRHMIMIEGINKRAESSLLTARRFLLEWKSFLQIVSPIVSEIRENVKPPQSNGPWTDEKVWEYWDNLAARFKDLHPLSKTVKEVNSKYQALALARRKYMREKTSACFAAVEKSQSTDSFIRWEDCIFDDLKIDF